MADHRHRAAIVAENRRMKAAIAAIHDLLHRGETDAAHAACECAMGGESVKQPSLSASDSADVQMLATEFNALVQRHGARAAMVAAYPVAGGEPGQVSLQLCGHVELCRIIETAMRGSSSFYCGDQSGASS